MDIIESIKKSRFDIKFLDRDNCKQIDPTTGYNIPMTILNIYPFWENILNEVIVFYILNLCDINFSVKDENDKDITLMTIFIDKAVQTYEKLNLVESKERFVHLSRKYFLIFLENGYTGRIPSLKRVPFLRPYIEDFIKPEEYIIDKKTIKNKQALGNISTHGDIFISYLENSNRDVCIKYAKPEKNSAEIDNSDFYKEYMISKHVNELFPDTLIDIYGFLETSHLKEAIVMEYAPFTLKTILDILIPVKISLKSQFVLGIFRKWFKKMNNFNKCGFCHFDTKIENVVVTYNFDIKIIDTGISAFLGLNRNRFRKFQCTITTKAPDEVSETRIYNNIEKEDLFFIDSLSEQDVRANYSTDMYAIASIMFSYMAYNMYHFQALITQNKFYKFINLNRIETKANGYGKYVTYKSDFSIVTNDVLNRMSIYSPKIFNFFTHTLTHDPALRFTCKEVLYHPLFRKDSSKTLYEPIPYCITDLFDVYFYNTTGKIVKKPNQFSNVEIILRQNELKIYDTYLMIAEKLKICKNTNCVKNFHFSDIKDIFYESILQQMDEDSSLVVGSIEYNFMLVLKENKHEIKNYFKLLDEPFTPLSGSYNFNIKEIYYFLIKCNIDMFQYSSAVQVYVTKLRIESKYPAYIISLFYETIDSYIIQLMKSDRDEDVLLFDVFDLYIKILTILQDKSIITTSKPLSYDKVKNEYDKYINEKESRKNIKARKESKNVSFK